MACPETGPRSHVALTNDTCAESPRSRPLTVACYLIGTAISGCWLLCVVLAQGAARHWVDGCTGVKDCGSVDVVRALAPANGSLGLVGRVALTSYHQISVGRRVAPARAWQSFKGPGVDLLARVIAARADDRRGSRRSRVPEPVLIL